MTNDLTLKFKSETGTSGMFENIYTEDGEQLTIPTDEYLEWLEDLALKQIKRDQPLYAEIKKLRSQLHEACDRLNQHGLL